MKKIKINSEYIELQQLLKMESIISSGGQAKYFLAENDVYFNGEKETRRGKKLRPGDVIKVNGEEYVIE